MGCQLVTSGSFCLLTAPAAVQPLHALIAGIITAYDNKSDNSQGYPIDVCHRRPYLLRERFSIQVRGCDPVIILINPRDFIVCRRSLRPDRCDHFGKELAIAISRSVIGCMVFKRTPKTACSFSLYVITKLAHSIGSQTSRRRRNQACRERIVLLVLILSSGSEMPEYFFASFRKAAQWLFPSSKSGGYRSLPGPLYSRRIRYWHPMRRIAKRLTIRTFYPAWVVAEVVSLRRVAP